MAGDPSIGYAGRMWWSRVEQGRSGQNRVVTEAGEKIRHRK